MGNSFGTLFRISSWGESHGGGIGVVIDGCPPRLPLTEDDIQPFLDRRRPGQSKITTPRDEEDKVEILSGAFEGKTLGTPIAMLVRNRDARPQAYDEMKEKFRPSHADFTYQSKFGIRNHEGGGRSSARETIARVAAGAIAKALLSKFAITVHAFLSAIGGIKVEKKFSINDIIKHCQHDPLRCPDKLISQHMQKIILQVQHRSCEDLKSLLEF